ncbi:hypothetical protein [Desertibacillus haloalkaliphilus]|uniref:hypothetical protein n=1 Tax=Desertibacillus haloalkaliphilus TaxID=1328930 RepID=UPI001C27A3EF|nr:hypothetical protein [Desertibacillus haloalkaliphilus]MBU8905056.1 hypothetical protein [Desertibacillus haloalkaliphilus]
MRLFTEQRGSTLLVTLLTVTVFMIVGMSVIAGTLTNAKQINQTEADIRATHLAEMGVEYFREKAIKKIVDQDEHPQSEREFTQLVNESATETESDLFSVMINDVELNSSSPDDRYTLISFSSYSNDAFVVIDSTLRINEKRFPTESPPDYEYVRNFEANNRHVFDDVYFAGGLTLSTHSTVIIHGHAYIDGDLRLQPHSTLTVHGNAFLNGTSKQLPNSDAFVVFGEEADLGDETTYYWDITSDAIILDTVYRKR